MNTKTEGTAMNKKQTKQHIKAHLEEGIDECRWCFAVDSKRVKAKEIARYHFPDATVLKYSCPRCGGEFSQYINGWCGDYISERINKLHPELGGHISDKLSGEVNHRVLFPWNLGDYLDY